MSSTNFRVKNRQGFLRMTIACLLVLCSGANLFAQYKGAPVKQERLLKVLRSRQLQTRDIVSVINSNGVDFRLTPEIKRLLIAAGARPEVIKAAANNSRTDFKGNSTFAKKQNKKVVPTYDDLIEQAIYSYKDRKKPTDAARYLQTAMKIKPNQPAAYQMLGFVNMYGFKNLAQAEKLMRQSIANGGSAVFRVYHDDSGGFSSRCSGSLYISPESIRFESDDNRHTFETSTVNIDRFALDTESNKTWKNHSVLKVFLKIGKDKAKFRFAPISGLTEESKMVGRFIRDSKIDSLIPISVTTAASDWQ